MILLFFRTKPRPEDIIDAVLSLFTYEEKVFLLNPYFNLRELLLKRVNKKTKPKYRTIEEAVIASQSLIQLIQKHKEIVYEFDRYDIWLLSCYIFDRLFRE